MSGGPDKLVLTLDQGVPRDAAEILRHAGYECTHVGEVGMSQAEDTEILNWARERGSAVVTLDADFHAILGVSGASAPSVIRLRLQGLDAPAVVAVIRSVVADYSAELLQGCMLTVKARKTTFHRLPIGVAE